MSVGQKIRSLRIQANLTEQDLISALAANGFKVSLTKIRQYEEDIIPLPRKIAFWYADEFKVPLEHFGLLKRGMALFGKAGSNSLKTTPSFVSRGVEYIRFPESTILCELRKESGLTQLELAELLEIPKTSLVNYELYSKYLPKEVITKYSEFFGITIEELVKKAIENPRTGNYSSAKVRLGKVMYKLRKDADLSQKKLAAELQIKAGSISNYEKGLIMVPEKVLVKYAKYFGLSVNDICVESGIFLGLDGGNE